MPLTDRKIPKNCKEKARHAQFLSKLFGELNERGDRWLSTEPNYVKFNRKRTNTLPIGVPAIKITNFVFNDEIWGTPREGCEKGNLRRGRSWGIARPPNRESDSGAI